MSQPHSSRARICPDCDSPTRRDFLKTTAAGVVTAAAAGTGLYSVATPRIVSAATSAAPAETLVAQFYKSLSEEQKKAVLARDLNWCISLGGNIYFLAKIGATDGKSFQQMAGSMTGMSEDEYREMMIKGGRSVEGNRYVGEKK